MGTVLLPVIVLLVMVRVFLFQPFNIPSASMSPSLNPGDVMIVSKFLPGDKNPDRGDIVVFHSPEMRADFVKRVVGFPGDKVQIRHGVLFINGAAMEIHRVADFSERCDSGTCRISEYEERFSDGKVDRILDRVTDGPSDNTDVFLVPPNTYFVLGDNRDNSEDSRNGLGYIERHWIIGRPIVKYMAEGHLVWQPID